MIDSKRETPNYLRSQLLSALSDARRLSMQGADSDNPSAHAAFVASVGLVRLRIETLQGLLAEAVTRG